MSRVSNVILNLSLIDEDLLDEVNKWFEDADADHPGFA